MDRTTDFQTLTLGRRDSNAKPHTAWFDHETTSLLTKIRKMKIHLTTYGHDYLNTYGYLPGACFMTEDQRNKFDEDVEKFIDSCSEKINELQSKLGVSSKSQQVIDHREAVIRIFRKTLKDLFSYFHHFKTTKIVRQMTKQKFDRIESTAGKISPSKEFDSIDDISLEKLSSEFGSEIETKSSTTSSKTKSNQADKFSSISLDDCQQQSLKAAEHHTSIAPNEISILAVENSQIHDELMTLDDEVKLIGKKVVQISKLQEILTEKVMEQTVDLDNLHDTAIKSSENVREGNDLIRDAMMKNASTRVFILFYIITLGFTILFLDWYNP